MKHLKKLALILAVITLLASLCACGEETKKEDSKETEITTKAEDIQSATNEIESDTISQTPENTVASLNVTLEDGRIITVYYPGNIDLEDYHIDADMPWEGEIEYQDNNACGVEFWYTASTDQEAFMNLCYKNDDFTIDSFIGLILSYEDETYDVSATFDNKGNFLGGWFDDTKKLCTGYTREFDENFRYGDSVYVGSDPFIYKDPSGNIISGEEYDKEYDRVSTIIIDGIEYEIEI